MSEMEVDSQTESDNDQTSCGKKYSRVTKGPVLNLLEEVPIMSTLNAFTEDASRLSSTPDLVHVIETEQVSSLMYHLRGNFYVPLTRCNVFYPHWLQDLMDKELRFSLYPITKVADLPLDCQEADRLLARVRAIHGKFSWDANLPICLQLRLAENHGNKILPRRHRLKPLLANSIYVDHDSKSVVFEGAKFCLAIGVPFPGDLEDNMDDPGAKIDVGMYIKELNTAPGTKLRWFVSLQRRDIPASAINLAENETAMNVMEMM